MFGRISLGKSTGSNSNRDSCKVTSSVTNNRGVRTDFDSSGRVCSVSNESSGSGANFPSGSDRDHPSGRSYSSGGSGVGVSTQLTSQVQNLSINTPQVPVSESINSRHGGKVVGTSQVGVDQEGTSLAVSKAISDAKAFPNYNNSYNSLGDTRAINLASSGVKDSDLSKFCAVINSYTFNLEALYLNNNAIGNNGIAELIPAIKGSKYTMYRQFENGQSVYPPRIVAEDLRFLNYKYDPSNPKFITQNVVFLNLCNNNIGDRGAKTLADALTSGELQSTKEIDLHGNSITKTGEGAIVKALKSDTVQDIIVLTQRLKDHSKLIFGSKEEKIAELKKFIQLGKEKGTYDEAVVVDKSWYGTVKYVGNNTLAAVKGGVGFAKCHFVPEDMATGYAQDKIAAKLPKLANGVYKYSTKLMSIKDIVTCYLGAVDEGTSSEPGISVVKHDLCVMGESEFCGDQ